MPIIKLELVVVNSLHKRRFFILLSKKKRGLTRLEAHMPTVWKEEYNSLKHSNKMWAVDSVPFPKANFITRWVFFVRVCSFTFEFHSLKQIKSCLDYYSKKIRPSSRLPVYTENYGDHWEAQRWYEQLPMYLLEEPKRQRVVKALTSAIKQFEDEEFKL